MKYYIIYLMHGTVVDINSWDEEDVRDRHFEIISDTLDLLGLCQDSVTNTKYDEAQKLNIVD